MQLFKIIVSIFLITLAHSLLKAHPTGNMIVVGDHVLWPYVCPVDDSGHHACVMIWSEGNEPEILIQSNHTSSDYMLYQNNEQIYIMERRFNTASKNEIRILKSSIGGAPEEIWPWTELDLRIGEGGFFMPSDQELVFVSYPNIYQLERGFEPKVYVEFQNPIKRLRALDDQKVLLLGDGEAWLTTPNGEVIEHWNDLLFDDVTNSPLNRNQIFDIDYQDGELLLAYWGNRSFDTIDSSGYRKVMIKFDEPITPHWSAYFGENKLLFASKLIMDGSNPQPHLLMQNIDHGIKKIWTIDQ